MLQLLAAFMGPVFAKEMVEMSRRKRYYFNRVLFGLVLLFSLFCVWDGYSHELRTARAPIRVMARIAESMFVTVSCVQFAAVFVFVPLFLSGVLASEREERTLDLLFTTHLKDREIVLGKLASRLAAAVLVILTALPILSLITLFGGVDPAALYRILSSTLVALIFAGAASIFFSAITKSPMGALVRTYWWLAVYLLGLPLAGLMIIASITPGPTHPWAAYYFGFVAFSNPITPFICGVEGNFYNLLSGHLGDYFYLFTFFIPLVLSALMLWRAVVQIRFDPTPFGVMFGWFLRWSKLRQLRQRWVSLTVHQRQRQSERIIGLLSVKNPLWLRSRLARVYDREGHIGRIQWAGWLFAAFFLVMVLVLERRRLNSQLLDDSFTMVFVSTTWIAIALLTAILAGISIVSDRRRGFFDSVLLTPLEPREIIDGTIVAVWEHLRRGFYLPVFLTILFSLISQTHFIPAMASMLTAILYAFLLIVIGVGCSLPARTFPGALVPTFVFPLATVVGITFFIPFLRSAHGPALWIFTAVYALATWQWVRRRPSAGSVGAWFLAIYLICASIGSFWTWKGLAPTQNPSEWPVAAMHPGFLCAVLLTRNFQREFSNSHLDWHLVIICYQLALILSIFFARRWLIHNFERLVERQDPNEMLRQPPGERSAMTTPRPDPELTAAYQE